MHSVSLASLTLHDVDVVKQIYLASGAGFDQIQLSLAPPPELHGPLIVGNKHIENEIRNALRETGLGVLDADTFRILETTHVADWHAALDFAAEVGTQFILASSDDPDMTRTADKLGELGAAAGERDLKVALEFLSYRTVGDLPTARKVVSDVGLANVGLVVDILHLIRSGGTLQQMRDLPPEMLFYGHLCDASTDVRPATRELLIEESVSDRLLPGEGVFDIPGFISTFPENAAFSLEAPFKQGKALSAETRINAAIRAVRSFIPVNA